MNVLIINGPNINLLGQREPDIYGTMTYQDLEVNLQTHCQSCGVSFTMVQSNHEGVIIDTIQTAKANGFQAIIINPAAYTHYSYAIYDALLAANLPAIEVHLTLLNKRENFRRQSVTAPACLKVFQGEHFLSYRKAIDFLIGVCHE